MQATTGRIGKVLAYWNAEPDMAQGSGETASSGPAAAPWMTMILRLGLACAGLFCWDASSQFFESGGAGMQALAVLAALGLWLLGLVLFFMAARRCPKPRLAWIILLASLLIFASDWQAQLPGQGGGTTDVWLFSDYSAQLLRAGHNPYASDMTGSFWINRTNIRYQTPLLDGDLTTLMPYPALAFLILVPFQWAGISTQIVYPLFLLLMIIALFLSAPPQWRPIAVLPILMTARFTSQAFGGSNDIVWAFFLVMMIWAWKRPGQRAMWFGLACAFKEQPWLLAPFLLIRLWHESRDASTVRRWRSLLEFAVVASLVFLVFNAPFIAWNASAWWNRIADSFTNNMILLGQGLASLTLFNVVTIPKGAFLLFMIATYLVALVLYWRHFDAWPEVLWLIPGLVFWLGHRSLNNYWFIFALPFFAALLRSESLAALEPVPGQTVPELIPPVPLGRARRPVSLALVLGLVLFIVGSLLVFKLRASPISLAVQEPIPVDGGGVNQLQVQVLNRSNATLTPRFSVLGSAWQPFFWQIQQGPATLDPGASATYNLSPSQADYAFGVNESAEVIMTDAATDNVRASALISPDPASQFVDPLPNGNFLYWDINTQTPYQWGLSAPENASRPVQMAPMENGRRTVHLTLPPVQDAINWSSVALRTWIPFPHSPIQAWVKPPAGANRSPAFDLAYGLELAPTGAPTRVWVLFGSEAGHGQLAPDLYYWMLKAPADSWSLQTIDVPRIFNSLGLPLPAPIPTGRSDLPYPTSMLDFRLLLAGRNQLQPVSAEFGPLHSVEGSLNVTALAADVIAHPDKIAVWHGQYVMAADNLELARTYFRQALDQNPQNADAYHGLGQVSLALKDWNAAESAFHLALQHSDSHLLSAYDGLGQAYTGLRRYDEAAFAFRQAVQTAQDAASDDPFGNADPATVGDAFTGLGLTLVGQQRCALAEPFLNQALNITPDDSRASNAIQACKQEVF